VKSSCERGNEPSGSRKMLGNYRVAAQLVASRAVLSSTELVSQLGEYSVCGTEGRFSVLQISSSSKQYFSCHPAVYSLINICILKAMHNATTSLSAGYAGTLGVNSYTNVLQ
jgi:hypothetical protein